MTEFMTFFCTEAGNILSAFLCIAALAGVDQRICLVLSLWMHLALIMI
ncbi:hypothetical protein [Yoonia sp. SS1-5]|uniref:Uncharacterized protein n=1 Tax=Yoonia rhodophyticola TaxID=3137370 RepID=A0AAN0M8R7_9RHOB